MDRRLVYLLVVVAMELDVLAMALRLARSAHGGGVVWDFELVALCVSAAVAVAGAGLLYREVLRAGRAAVR